MTPYYEDDHVTIYHGDCREVLPAVTFDVIVTDAPYGVGLDYASHDDSLENLDALIVALTPHLMATRSAVFSGVGAMHHWPQPTWTLCWYEPAGTRTGKWGFSTWQPILVYGADPFLATGKGRRPDSFRVIASSKDVRVGTGDHPCPKPIDVVAQVIARVSPDPAEVIVDPFMGSGTTLRAAKNLGRRAIGVEIEERYCEIAARRMGQEVLDFGGAA